MSNAVTEKTRESKVGYVGRRLSMKQAKMFLASTPRNGAFNHEMMKFYMGLRKTEPVDQTPRKKPDGNK